MVVKVRSVHVPATIKFDGLVKAIINRRTVSGGVMFMIEGDDSDIEIILEKQDLDDLKEMMDKDLIP